MTLSSEGVIMGGYLEINWAARFTRMTFVCIHLHLQLGRLEGDLESDFLYIPSYI